MTHAKLIDTDIDHSLLESEIHQLIDNHQLHDQKQVSLTSIAGNDDWTCTTGKLSGIKYNERYYSTLNHSLSGTYIENCINRYSDFYRWRLLKLLPHQVYTIHQDSRYNNELNIRLHIPVITDPAAYLIFFDNIPVWSDKSTTWYNLEAGNSYEVNTTGVHTAANFSSQPRYHIVGVKYESPDYWDKNFIQTDK